MPIKTKFNINSDVFDHMPVGIAITDKNATVLYVNEMFSEITLYPPSEIIGKQIGKTDGILYSGYYSDDFYKNMWETIENNQNYSAQIRNKKKDGSYYWQSTNIVPIEDNYILYMYDITDIVEKETMLSKVLENIPGIVYVFDVNSGQNLFINSSSKTLLGYTPEEMASMKGGFLNDIIHPEDIQQVSDKHIALLNLPNGGHIENTFRCKTKNGDYEWFYCKEAVFDRNSNNKPMKKIGIMMSIDSEIQKDDIINNIKSLLDYFTIQQDEIHNNLKLNGN